MSKNIILVDFENRGNLDLSSLDKSYSAIIFVGHHQEEPRIKKKIDRKSGLVLVDYLKVDGVGKNGLDFHIAFKLGQIYETEPNTHCYILSADKGFDPLLKHFKNIGFSCKRVEALAELPTRTIIKYGLNEKNPELTVCRRCKQANTIEHNGGRWCTNCGKFAAPPDPEITSMFTNRPMKKYSLQIESTFCCDICSQEITAADSIYDDGDWICWGCLTGH